MFNPPHTPKKHMSFCISFLKTTHSIWPYWEFSFNILTSVSLISFPDPGYVINKPPHKGLPGLFHSQALKTTHFRSPISPERKQQASSNSANIHSSSNHLHILLAPQCPPGPRDGCSTLSDIHRKKHLNILPPFTSPISLPPLCFSYTPSVR